MSTQRIIKDRYIITKRLGSGSYGKVYEVQDKSQSLNR